MNIVSVRRILGWVAVIISAAITSLWAFWGAAETFHEGWYSTSIWENLGLMLVQYLSPMLAFMFLALVAHRYPRIGGVLHVVAGACIVLFVVKTPSAMTLILIPMVALGLMYFFSTSVRHHWALALNVALPLIVALVVGWEPASTVMHRYDDGIRGMRTVQGNGVALQWAPEGPGCPDHGVGYEESKRICSHLTADGTTLSDSVLNIWRLPTVEEAVRSLTRNGVNAGGVWDPVTRTPSYTTKPDKETPLWNPHSMIIYWWTSSEADSARVFRVVFNGMVTMLPKKLAMGDMAFRAVRAIPQPQDTTVH